MPLNISVKRNGKPVKFTWDDVTLNCVLTAAIQESDPDLAYDGEKTFGNLPEGKFVDLASTGVYYIDTKCPLWKSGRLTLDRDHNWTFKSSDPNYEDRIIDLKAGDVIEMYRSHS